MNLSPYADACRFCAQAYINLLIDQIAMATTIMARRGGCGIFRPRHSSESAAACGYNSEMPHRQLRARQELSRSTPEEDFTAYRRCVFDEAKGPRLRSSAQRIFLLSPANLTGVRGQSLLRAEAKFDLALRLRGHGAALGELFSFMSSLYFRGKLAYSQAFSNPPADLPGALIITPSQGLLSPETIVNLSDMREMSAIRVDAAEEKYRGPLERAAGLLKQRLAPDVRVVLLGSIATPKYVLPLSEIFGEQLLFPLAFVGRGDMSRGGLLLRCSKNQVELEYAPIVTTCRRGARPPKLPPVRARASSNVLSGARQPLAPPSTARA